MAWNFKENATTFFSDPSRSKIKNESANTSQPHTSSQLLINGSFELWEDPQSLVVWKGKNVSREVNPNNIRTGRAALRMPVNSFIYQFISSDLNPNSLYQATLYARIEGDKNEHKDGCKDQHKHDEQKDMNVPLIASISFFNALGDPIGYKTQIIVDPFNVGTHYQPFKVLVESPEKAETARLTLFIDGTSEDNQNSYIVDDVTFQQMPDENNSTIS